MKKTLVALLSLLVFASNPLVASAQNNSTPTISFADTQQLPSDTKVAVPVYVNTYGHELNSLQVKIDLLGSPVENLDLEISSNIPIQEISRVIENNSVFIIVSSLDLEQTWKTSENTELFNLTFQHEGEGVLTLTFDPNETVASSNLSDENVLRVGSSTSIQFGEILPATSEVVGTTAMTETAADMAGTNPPASDTIDSNLLVAVVVISFVAAAGLLLYMFKTKPKSTSNPPA